MDCNKAECCRKIASLANFLQVISEENRLKIICYLSKNGVQCVCEIQAFFNLPQNLVSHHLKILKDADLLNASREGSRVYYSLNSKEFKKQEKLFWKVLTQGKK